MKSGHCGEIWRGSVRKKTDPTTADAWSNSGEWPLAHIGGFKVQGAGLDYLQLEHDRRGVADHGEASQTL